MRLVIVGAVHIAQALVPMAAGLGYGVFITDPRRAFATDERFPGVTVSTDWPDEALDAWRPDARTAIVTLTHDPKLDDPALDRALKSPAFYVGALGSRKTHAARLDRLRALGHDDAALARIRGPVGLTSAPSPPARSRSASWRSSSPSAGAPPRDLRPGGAGPGRGLRPRAHATPARPRAQERCRPRRSRDRRSARRRAGPRDRRHNRTRRRARGRRRNPPPDALLAPGLDRSRAGTGRVNLIATRPGLLRIDAAAVNALNAVNEALTLATLPDWASVAAGEMVATIKIIPFAVPGAVLDRAVASVDAATLRLHPTAR